MVGACTRWRPRARLLRREDPGGYRPHTELRSAGNGLRGDVEPRRREQLKAEDRLAGVSELLQGRWTRAEHFS